MNNDERDALLNRIDCSVRSLCNDIASFRVQLAGLETYRTECQARKLPERLAVLEAKAGSGRFRAVAVMGSAWIKGLLAIVGIVIAFLLGGRIT